MNITEEHDRIHIFTKRVEWTIMMDFLKTRGPCYISDVRTKNGKILVSDGLDKHTINDSHYGGLFSFGLVAAADPVINKPFWDWAWEITTKLKGPNFGMSNWSVRHKDNIIHAQSDLLIKGTRVMQCHWTYRFFDLDRVELVFEAFPEAPPFPLYYKEPKIVANGLLPYKMCTVFGKADEVLNSYNLAPFHDPRKHTRQIPDPKRRAFSFDGQLMLEFDDGFTPWVDAADKQQSFSSLSTPHYCLPLNVLLRQTEVTSWGGGPTGLLHHGWEGGYGAPDCWGCFRPWPTTPIKILASATFRV